jgi:hypothetical protein
MFYDNKRVSNYSLVSIPVATAGTYLNFNFPDQPQLRGRKVERIVNYNQSQVPTSPDGQAVIPAASVQQCYLVLYINGREDIKISLVHLSTLASNTGAVLINNNGYIPLQDVNIIWEKSYVKAPRGIAVAANSAICFGVFYK